jgi:hypothetical protein
MKIIRIVEISGDNKEKLKMQLVNSYKDGFTFLPNGLGITIITIVDESNDEVKEGKDEVV